MSKCRCMEMSTRTGTCDACIKSGRAENGEREFPPLAAVARPTTTFHQRWNDRIHVPDLRDGEYRLPRGGTIVVRSRHVQSLLAPMRPDPSGWGTTVQSEAAEDTKALVGCEVLPGFWRVDRDAYVAEWPVRMPEGLVAA